MVWSPVRPSKMPFSPPRNRGGKIKRERPLAKKPGDYLLPPCCRLKIKGCCCFQRGRRIKSKARTNIRSWYETYIGFYHIMSFTVVDGPESYYITDYSWLWRREFAIDTTSLSAVVTPEFTRSLTFIPYGLRRTNGSKLWCFLSPRSLCCLRSNRVLRSKTLGQGPQEAVRYASCLLPGSGLQLSH